MPGKTILDTVKHVSFDRIADLIGEDVIATLNQISAKEDLKTRAELVVKHMFDANPMAFLSSVHRLTVLLSGLTPEESTELAIRLNAPPHASIDPVKIVSSKKHLEIIVGFFGGDARDPYVMQEPSEKTISPQYALFDYQRSVCDRTLGYLGDEHGRLIMHMPTGAGKTRTAMHVICRVLLSRKNGIVVWLANSVELLDQASDSFERAWSVLGNRDVEVARFWGSLDKSGLGIRDGVIFASLQKLFSLNSQDPLSLLRLGSRTVLVVVDEAHISVAPTYNKVIEQLSETGKNNALLGLTATPGRSWNETDADRQLSAFFHERKVGIRVENWADPVAYLVSEGYLAETHFRNIEFDYGLDHEMIEAEIHDDYTADLLSTIGLVAKRNAIIIEEIQRLISEGHRRIMFFGSSVQQAEIVSSSLNAIGIISNIVTASTTKRARTRAIKEYRSQHATPSILCNYGVLTTGFDAPGTSAAVIGRPTKSLVLYSQMVGRACRGPRAGGNESATISTVVDLSLTGFRRITDAFHNWEDVWQGETIQRD
jgi:DNA repair protein RadD